MKPAAPYFLIILALLALTGCVSRTVRSVDMSPIDQAESTIPEDLLLDIGVAIFDTNVPTDFEEMEAAAINPEVRRAESNFMPYVLKELLQSTGYWGAVRVVPRLSNAVDLTLLSRIEESDGAFLTLHTAAVDATGKIWFQREYEGEASKYAYDDSIPRNIDPFQSLYKSIATDLKSFYDQLSAEQIHYLRRTAQLRFAAEMAPEAFRDYLEVSDDGRVEIRRLPAENDPLLARVEQVREREYLFIDTLDEHYAEFFNNMYTPYKGYRKASFTESVARRRAEQEALSRTIAGAASVVGGITAVATSESGAQTTGGAVGITGGAFLLKSAFMRRADARFHSESLLEIAQSLESEVAPHTIQLESEVIHLSGTVSDQYGKLREALTRMYRRELGLPEVGDTVETAPATNTSTH